MIRKSALRSTTDPRNYGGEGGIRTHGALAGTPHFECGAFDHSATSPLCWSAQVVRGLSHSGEKSGWQGAKCKSSYPFALTVFYHSRKPACVQVVEKRPLLSIAGSNLGFRVISPADPFEKIFSFLTSCLRPTDKKTALPLEESRNEHERI
jgi:hypothetical protein